MAWGDRWDDLRSLVSRLGNGTESVRTEALKSIMFKLKHGMYSAWEVSEHAAIFSYLLEWFNRPSPPLLDDALDLLSVLARDERGGGARTLIEVGGIAFLQVALSGTQRPNQTIMDVAPFNSETIYIILGTHPAVLYDGARMPRKWHACMLAEPTVWCAGKIH